MRIAALAECAADIDILLFPGSFQIAGLILENSLVFQPGWTEKNAFVESAGNLRVVIDFPFLGS